MVDFPHLAPKFAAPLQPQAIDAYKQRLIDAEMVRRAYSGQGSAMPILGSIADYILGIPERAIKGAMGTVGPGGVITSSDAPEAWGQMAEAGYDAAEMLAGAGATRSMANAARGMHGVELGTGGTRTTSAGGAMSKAPRDVPQTLMPRYIPPRGVPQRIVDITTNPEVRKKMLAVIRRGIEMGGADWYDTTKLRKAFIKELGKRKGQEAFHKYMDFVAATSPRSEVGVNARNASYYYHRYMNDQPMPQVGEKNPAPYGHMAQKLHQQNANAIAGPGWDPLKNPKPSSFSENLSGNWAPATIDTHAFRLPALLAKDSRFLMGSFNPEKGVTINPKAMFESGELTLEDALKRPAYWESQPAKTEYAAMEDYYRSLAEELGISPAQAQAAAWVGGGKITGLGSDATKGFVDFVFDRVALTAEKMKLSQKDVLSGFIKGKMPLLGFGGGAVLSLEQLPPSVQDVLAEGLTQI